MSSTGQVGLTLTLQMTLMMSWRLKVNSCSSWKSESLFGTANNLQPVAYSCLFSLTWRFWCLILLDYVYSIYMIYIFTTTATHGPLQVALMKPPPWRWIMAFLAWPCSSPVPLVDDHHPTGTCFQIATTMASVLTFNFCHFAGWITKHDGVFVCISPRWLMSRCCHPGT